MRRLPPCHWPRPRRWLSCCAVALAATGVVAGPSEESIQSALQDRWGAESEVVLDEVVLDDGAAEASGEDLPASSVGAAHHEVVDDFVWDYSDPVEYVEYSPDPSPPPSVQSVPIGASQPVPAPAVDHVAVEHVAVGGSPAVQHVEVGRGAASHEVQPEPSPPPAVEHVPVSHGGGYVAEPQRVAPKPVKYVPPPLPTVRHVIMDRPRPPPPPPPPPDSYCNVAKRDNCTDEELKFLDTTKAAIGSNREELVSEAKRLRSKIGGVKKNQRAWLGQRAHVLDGLLALLPPAPPKRRRQRDEEL